MREPYDPDNIFTKIMRGEMPCHEVFQDDETFAFMDIMPRGEGHTLVIPKRGFRNLLDADLEGLAAVTRTVARVAQAQTEAFGADGITVQQFNEPAGGQVVFHYHVHVIPRFEGVKLRPHTGEMANDDLLAGHAEKLRKALQE